MSGSYHIAGVWNMHTKGFMLHTAISSQKAKKNNNNMLLQLLKHVAKQNRVLWTIDESLLITNIRWMTDTYNKEHNIEENFQYIAVMVSILG